MRAWFVSAVFCTTVAAVFLPTAATGALPGGAPFFPAQVRHQLVESAVGLAYGSPAASIGTFDGWTFWIGWDGSFSENYDPFSETYAWVVYFAPEGVFLALQWAESNYSNVDTYAAFDYFYGVMRSPFGATLPKSFVNNLNGITLSIDAFNSSFAPVGALSQLSLAISSAQTVFRVGALQNLQRAIQYSAGMTASFSLMPFSLPFGVSLDYDSGVEAGFYPIILWDLDARSGQSPIEQIRDELERRSTAAGTGFPGCYDSVIASMLVPFLDSLPAAAQVEAFMAGDGTSAIDSRLESIEQWLRTGDTAKLPGGIDLPEDPAAQYEAMRPVKAIVDACFELGYEHGYRSTDRDDTVYADCVETVACTPGDNCTIEVTAEEMAALVPGSAPADFEDVWVAFDLSAEEYLVSEDTVYWGWVEDGTASYTFVNNTDYPMFLGVAVEASEITGDRSLELCRRHVVFEETFEVAAVDYGQVEVDDASGSGPCPAAALLAAPEDAAARASLRRFRDTVMCRSALGSAAIGLYYRTATPVRGALRNRAALRTIAQWGLRQGCRLLRTALK